MNINSAQITAWSRNVVSYGAGAVTCGVVLHFLTPADAGTITDAINQIGDGFAKIVAGFATLITFGNAFYAAYTASHKSQLNAVAANPDVVKVIVADKPLADSIPSPKVVAPGQ